MHLHRIFGCAVLVLSGASSLAQAQDSPSFDCSKARTHVEKALCSDYGTGLGWIDRTMAELFKASHQVPGADPDALQASQRAWLAQRNHCSGSDDKITACLLASYRARFVELSAPYDQRHLTGKYTSDEVNGDLDGVLFPDGTLSVGIRSAGPPPAYDQCAISFRAPLDADKLHYVAPAADVPDDKCTVDLTVNSSRLHVVSTPDCRSYYCGGGAVFDGAYRK